MPEDAGKFAEKIGVYAQNSIVNIHNQNIGVSDDSGATPINWQEICRQLLESQRRLTSNPLMQDESAKLQREQIYVPLALVQRTKPEKRDKDDVSPEAGTRLYEPQYEEKQRFEHEAFLTQILEKAQSKTKGKHIALIGEPGAGKTTLLQSIAFWVLEKNLGFPIWISLADLGRSGSLTDLQSYLLNNWLSLAVPPTQLTQAKEELTTQIQQGRVWLLLDGVDEVAVSGVQTLQPIAQQLTGWIAQSRVVLTCRLNVWQADYNALETFETYRLLDFDYPKQVHQFIDNWFGNLTPQRNLTPQPPLLIKERGSDKSEERGRKAERLKAELDNAERGRLRDLVQNPLRLTLLCSAWQSGEGDLPQTKAGLYQQFVQQIYTWKQNRFPISTEERQKLNNALGRLALRDIQEGGSRFRLLESFITKELGDPDDEKSSFYKALQLGWLNHVGIAAESQSKEKVYAFFHATFEEYFAALAIDDWDFFLPREHKDKPVKDKDTGKPKPYRIFEPQWKEVILLWLGREDVEKVQKEEFIKALVEFNDGCDSFYKYRAYFLAAAGIDEFGECSRVDEVVAQIVHWSFGYFNTTKKQWKTFLALIEEKAKTALHQTHRAKAIDALVKLIADSQDESTRRQALQGLGQIGAGNQTVIDALVKFIADSQDESTRRQAAQSLRQINPGNEIAIDALVKLIADSQDEYTRGQLAQSLGKIGAGNEIAIDILVKLIADSHDEYIRWQAAEKLRQIDPDNQTVIDALVKLITNSQDEYTRWQAAQSLGQIDPGNQTVIDALVKLIADSQDEYIRWQAAEKLGQIDPNNQTVIDALVKLIADSQDEYIRWQAAEKLGQIDPGNEIAINVFVKLITNSQDEYTRWQAAQSLGQIDPGNQTGIDALVKFIADSQDKYTRWQAAETLGEINPGNEIAIDTLVKFIADSHDEYTRGQALQSLGKIGAGNEIAIDALVKLIADSQDEYTRGQLAETLGEINPGNEIAIDTLVKLIADSHDEYIRWQAAEKLGQIDPDNQTVIDALVNLSPHSQSESTRREVADTLGKIDPDNKDTINALVKLIAECQDGFTRMGVADTLGKIDPGNKDAIDTLVKLIADSQDESTRRESAKSLENILPADQMPKVVTALRDNSKPNQERYKIIWHCAQSMSYPDFYQAWHHRSYMKLAIRSARYRWWQIALCLFLGLSIPALVRFTVSHNVNNPANIQRQQQLR